MSRYYMIHEPAVGQTRRFIGAETIAPVPNPYDPDETEEYRRNIIEENCYGTVVTREELEATPEGRKLLEAWETGDDSASDEEYRLSHQE